MARITFSGSKEYRMALNRLIAAVSTNEMLEAAVRAGAPIVADKIRENLEKLPETEYRVLKDGEKFEGIPKGQKRDLEDSFGLTPIERDKDGFVHAKAGFDGYGSFPTKWYPKGVPNQLLARAVESGSSVREKIPFVRPAVQATRKKAVEAMEKVLEDKITEALTGK